MKNMAKRKGKKYSALCFTKNTCCKFTYKGKTVYYDWCGPGCGLSGSSCTNSNTENALDKCCCKHDQCYKKYKDYKGSDSSNRCKCDKDLLSCSNGLSNPGTSRLRTAFIAKRAAMLCS